MVIEKSKFNHTDLIQALKLNQQSCSYESAEIALTGVSTDSRTIRKGDLFFALVGDNFDGHNFIDQAIANGAAAVVVSQPTIQEQVPVFTVDNTLKAFGDLALYYRSQFDLLCLAVTGANGKTTTKEMLAACLETKFNMLKTIGNFNNLIGLPQTLFDLAEHHQAGVFELGMSIPGEMGRLARICRPDIAAFTNIAPVHLETMGTVDNVARAKYELVANMPEDTTIIINSDDRYLSTWPEKSSHRFVSYGIDNEADIKALNISYENNQSHFEISGVKFVTEYPGSYNILNALAAIAAGLEAGCDLKAMADRLRLLKPSQMRSEIVSIAGTVFIIDCYNANPESMQKAIDALAEYQSNGERFAVLGDMYELGKLSQSYHQQIGEYLNLKGVDNLLSVGSEARSYNDKFKGEINQHYSDKTKLSEELKTQIKPGDIVLVKGSRGMSMEDIIKSIKGVG